MKQPLVSIIIPCRSIDEYTRECIRRCRALKYRNMEIIVLPDEATDLPGLEDISVLPSGKIGPSVKRNTGIEQAHGEIVAFIDSDAYPAPDWIDTALKYLEDNRVTVIGGPGLTPPEDSLRQQASGDILSSFVCSGKLAFLYRSRGIIETTDLQSCNMMTRTETARQIGGYDTRFYPGEDTKFCIQARERGGKVLYVPDMVVYHHRRNVFRPHLKQIYGYGFQNRIFRQLYKEIFHLIPLAFLFYLLAGTALSFFFEPVRWVFSISLAVYLTLVATSAAAAGIRRGSLKLAMMVGAGIILTHVWYGWATLVGLTRRTE